MIDQSRGKTAINHQKRHHPADIQKWNNWMNTKDTENVKAPTRKFDTFKAKLDRDFENQTGPKSIEDLMS